MSTPVNIYVQAKDLEDLILFYDQKLSVIKEKKSELEKDEKEVRTILMQLKSKKAIHETPPDSSIKYSIQPNKLKYNRKGTWAQKIEFAIREKGEPLTTNEIVDLLIIQEPVLEEDKRKSITSVSSILSINSGKRFIKIDDGINPIKYFLPEGNVEIEVTDSISIDDSFNEEEKIQLTSIPNTDENKTFQIPDAPY